MSAKPLSEELARQLASVKVDADAIKKAMAEGRALRRDFEEQIAEMRAVTADDLKSRSR